MNTIRATSHVALAIMVLALLNGCDGGSPQPADDDTGYSSTDDSATPTDEPLDEPTDDAVDEPVGEIWQWALGRDLFTDPALQPYTSQLGTDAQTEVFVHEEGFELTGDEFGDVTAVTVFNDETMLGFPVSETSMSAYQGQLPAGITWADTAAGLDLATGGPGVVCIGGIECSWSFVDDEGHDVVVSFAARDPDDFANSRIHWIEVR